MMRRAKKKSVIIAICGKCRGRYEVEGLQSVRICGECREIRKCAHGVEVTKECAACIRVHGNRLLRVM